jgi:cell division protein FtsI/penicillin-binding protein 2
MSSPAPLGMFIIGFIIFALYMWGLLTMVVRSHKKQREEFNNDPEIQEYYRRLEVKDRRKKRVKKNERQKV